MNSLTTFASPFIPAASSLPAAALHFAAMSLKDFLKSTARKRFDWMRASVRWRRFSRYSYMRIEKRPAAISVNWISMPNTWYIAGIFLWHSKSTVE